MKRWIPATCVALLCGAAFGQTCDKSQSCGKQTAAAVSLVKADTDGGAQSDCPHAKTSVVAVSETKSCCAEGQSTAAAIIAVAATKDAGCSADKSTCTKSTAAITKVAATDAKTCSQTSTCSQGAGTVTTVAGPVNKACPMSGKPISDASLVKYNGKTIGFCGEGCAKNFDGATADQQKKLYTTILASQPKRDVDLIED